MATSTVTSFQNIGNQVKRGKKLQLQKTS